MTNVNDNRFTGDQWLCEELPAEVLGNIGQHLTTTDRLKLRQVLPKKHAAFVEDMLKGELQILYVSPTKKYLRNFKRICSSKFYQQHITQVVFVARCIDPEYEVRDFATYRKREEVAKLDDEALERSWCRYQELIKNNLPQVYTQSQICEAGIWRPSEKVIKVLADGMSSLPGLNAVSIISDWRAFGVNANALWHEMRGFFDPTGNGYYCIWDDEEVRPAWRVLSNTNVGFWEHGTEGIEEFFEALRDAEVNLDAVALGNGSSMPLGHEIQGRYRSRMDEETVLEILTKPWKLSINCEEYDHGYKEYPLWKAVAERAISLQELTLYIRGGEEHTLGYSDQNPYWKKPVLEYFLQYGSYPHLKKLHIEGPFWEPGIVDTPLLKAFLARQPKLSDIVLRNILVDVHAEDQGVCKAIKSLLAYATESLGTDAYFKMSPDKTRDYLVRPDIEIQAEEMDALAQELGVELKDDKWDFGEVVMLARRAQRQ